MVPNEKRIAINVAVVVGKDVLDTVLDIVGDAVIGCVSFTIAQKKS